MNTRLGYLGLLSLALLATSMIPTSAIAPVDLAQTGDNVIIYALPYDFDEYSIYTADSYATNQWASAVYGSLFARSAADDRDWTPQLADSMATVSASNLNFTVTLKDGLLFSNGNALTASDVAFSLKAAVTPSINTYFYGTYVGFMNNESVTVIDDTTLRFDLLSTFAFPYSLLSFPIIDEETFGTRYSSCVDDGVAADCVWNSEDGSDVVSSAPFKVTYIDNVNEIVTVVKDTNWYDAEHVYTDKIIFQKIADKSAAISALAAGLIDILDSQYVAGLTELEDLPEVTEAFVGDPSHQEISLNHLNPYFGTGESIPGNTGVDYADALLVRRAMSHIVDRDFAVNEILEGLGLPAATAMPAASLGWDSTIEADAYDVDAARALMEDAGFDYATLGTEQSDGTFPSNFFEVTVLSPNTNGARNQWSANYVLELPKIGIGVTEHISTGWGEISPRTFGYTGGTLVPDYASGGFDVFFVGYGWTLDWNPAALYDASGRCDTGDCGNFINFDVDEDRTQVAQLVNEYLSELDFDLRIAKVKELQAELKIQMPVLPILYPQSHWGFADNIEGIDPLLISTSSQEWNLVIKSGWEPSTTTVVNTDTETATTTVQGTVTESADAPISSFGVIFGLFFAGLIATYMRRKY